MTRVGMELRKEGIKEGILETANKMVKKGFSIEDIIEVTDLKREEVQKLYELNKEKH